MKSIRELLRGRNVPVVSVHPEASTLDAARRMKQAAVGALLVVDSRDHACGMFTERDLMLRVVVAGRDPATTTVGEVMTPDLYTSPPERRINDVAREMQERHIRHLPVVEGKQVIGMLSLRDLLREHLAIKREEVEALTSYIQGEAEAMRPAKGSEA